MPAVSRYQDARFIIANSYDQQQFTSNTVSIQILVQLDSNRMQEVKYGSNVTKIVLGKVKLGFMI